MFARFTNASVIARRLPLKSEREWAAERQRVEWEGDQVRRQEHVPYSAMPIEENRGLTQSLIHLDDLQLRFKKTNEF